MSKERDYSGVPLAKKLGFKPGFTAVVENAPEGFLAGLSGHLEGVVFAEIPDAGSIDLAICFAKDQGAFVDSFRRLQPLLKPSGMLWVAWPKKSSGVPTDVNFEFVQPFGLGAGLVDVKVCAIDETWTALKFLYRLKDR